MIPLQPASGSAKALEIPRLTMSTREGDRYVRRADVESAITLALGRPRAEWGTLVAEEFPAEALVFLIRQVERTETTLFGTLINELMDRILKTARKWAKGFDTTNTEEILFKVEQKVIDLLLAESPSRQSEYLEIAFTDKVKKLTLNAVQKCKSSPLYRTKDVTDSTETAEPADHRPVPDEVLLLIESRTRRPELMRRAYAAVKDRRHLEAVILRHVHNWPIKDKDPDTPTLAKRYGKSGRQIQNWISDALEAMRTAIGEKV